MKSYLTAILCAFAISPVAAEIKISDAQIRAVPPSQKITAAFMTIENNGTEDLAILSASSPVSEVVEIHSHIHNGDRMEMRQIAQIDLPAGKTQLLKPGGLHLMLIGLQQPIVIGEEVEISIALSNGETLDLSLPVREIVPMMRNQAEHSQQK